MCWKNGVIRKVGIDQVKGSDKDARLQSSVLMYNQLGVLLWIRWTLAVLNTGVVLYRATVAVFKIKKF